MPQKLGELEKGQIARILSFQESEDGVIQRLMEIGLIEGARIEVVHEAPFSRDPIVVRARGALIALRRNEANQVSVEVEKE